MITREQFERWVRLELRRVLGDTARPLPEFMLWDIHTGYLRQFLQADITVEDTTVEYYQQKARDAAIPSRSS